MSAGRAGPEPLLLAGGLVVDGTGRGPPRRADVLLGEGRVEAVLAGTSPGPEGAASLGGVRRLDCSGALVTPGFIDIHTHSDLTWLSTPDCSSRVTQGVPGTAHGPPGGGQRRPACRPRQRPPDGAVPGPGGQRGGFDAQPRRGLRNIAGEIYQGADRRLLLASAGHRCDPGFCACVARGGRFPPLFAAIGRP